MSREFSGRRIVEAQSAPFLVSTKAENKKNNIYNNLRIELSQSLVGDGTSIVVLGLFVKLSGYIENYNRNITVKGSKTIACTSLKLKLKLSLICLLATLTPVFQIEVT